MYFKSSIAVLFVLLMVLVSGCSTLNQSQHSSNLQITTVAPLQADIEVGKKISGSASMTRILGIFNFGPNEYVDGVNYGDGGNSLFTFSNYNELKGAAAYVAVTAAKADVIIAPQYIVQQNNYILFKTINVTVNGYEGNIKGFKSTDKFSVGFTK
jgi:uncharacterized protein YceK